MNLKKQIRENWKKNFPRDTEWRREASRKVVDLVMNSSEFRSAEKIGIYSPFAWELDLTSLWQSRPTDCVFPKTYPDSMTLEFYHVRSLLELKPGVLNILEPTASPDLKVTDWKSSDLLLIPGFGFDLLGARVGGGKGYYDRFLSKMAVQPLRWAVCFQAQVSKQPIPLESYDVRMNAICTEKEITVVSGGAH